MTVSTTFKETGPKKYTAEEINLYLKVFNGAPLGPDFLVSFSHSQVVNPLEENTNIQKEDESRTSCAVLPACIDDAGAGEGLYASAKFQEGHVLGKYWGCLALVLDNEVNRFHWFGHDNRAVLLKAQPFMHTELGPARLYGIGH